jgi:hypothetical protein
MLDSSSITLNKPEYARKSMSCVQKFEVSIERKFGGKENLDLEIVKTDPILL